MKINIKTEKLLNFIPHSLITNGFNAYNYTKGYAKIKGGMKYCVKGAYSSLSFAKTENGEKTPVTLITDSLGQNGEILDSSYQRFLSNVDGYLFVTGGNITNTCVSLVWSGYKNNEYQMYSEDVRNIPITTYFPNGMNGVNGIYDELRKNKAIKRFGVVDLGTLTYYKSSSPQRFEVSTPISDAKPPASNSENAKMLCSKYVTKNNDTVIDLCIVMNTSGQLRIYDNGNYSKTAEEFKSAMSGVYLVYELATPEETLISPELNMTYSVNDFGTEGFIFNVNDINGSVPCMCFYQDNLKDKLRNINELTTTELQEILDILA